MVSVYAANGTVSIKEGLRTEHFLKVVRSLSLPSTVDRYERAIRWIEEHTQEQSGTPISPSRSLEVAIIAAGLQVDPDGVIAALLLPFYQTDDASRYAIEREFGEPILRLVIGVRRMDVIDARIESTSTSVPAIANAEALRKMLVAMVQDVRVAVLKLAERLYLLRHIDQYEPGSRDALALDSLNYFAPLANRLGVWQLKWELEDLSFRHLHPDVYRSIAQGLNERRVDRERYLGDIIVTIEQALKRAGIQASVVGRAKHIYSIFRKMQRKHLSVEQIHDIRAIRILVSEVKDCYAALGVVHGLWTFIPDQFDDYIATPKGNDYKSIHTAVMGPEGKAIEVQIRTHAMHEHNEFGVAAHWRYKEGVPGDITLDQKINWLRQVLQWGGEFAAAGAVADRVSSDVLQSSVYVFTPGGDIVDLPRGATPLDFAYQVHTELGHRCRGAKVNGAMVPLTHVLETSDQVEVLTTKQGGPSRDWLNPERGYLRSAKARARVAHWFRQENQQRSVELGRQVLMRELTRLGKRDDVRVETAAKRLGFSSDEMLFAAVGRGDVRVGQVVDACREPLETPATTVDLLDQAEGTATKTEFDQVSARRQVPSHVLVVGVDNLLTNLAHCCHPIPGDEILGYVTRGRGVSVHRNTCRELNRMAVDTPDRVIGVSWGEVPGRPFLCVIVVTAVERPGLLRDVSHLIEDEQINVVAARLVVRQHTHEATMQFTVSIATLIQLNNAIDRIRQLRGISSVRRM